MYKFLNKKEFKMELDWENKKYTYITCLVLFLIMIYSFAMSLMQKSEANSQILKGEKTLGHYKILAKNGPTPFTVDLLEVETNKTLKDVFISGTCPDYANINTTKTYQLFRYKNLQVKTGISTYSYEGLYEAVCAKVKKEINEERT